MGYGIPYEDSIQHEVRIIFSKLSNGYTLDKMSYEDASSHYDIDYDRMDEFVTIGTTKRLMFFEDDWQIEKYLSEAGWGSIDFIKLSSLYPKQKNIIVSKGVNIIYAPIFKSEDECRDFLIKVRWNEKPKCPHCGSIKSYKIEDGKRFKCGNSLCYKKYSVFTNTVFSSTNLPYTKLVAAIYIGLSKSINISSIKLAEILSTTQKTAWTILDDLKKNEDDDFVRKIKIGCLKMSLKNIGNGTTFQKDGYAVSNIDIDVMLLPRKKY